MAQRENTKNPIPSNALADLNDNTIILDEWTNSSAAYTTDRFGNPILTLKKILANYQAAVNDINSGSFLPMSGGTVTGLTNFTGGLQSGGKTVFTINGGTVTGTTNFTGALQYKGVSVLKVGDYGLGGNAATIKDVDSSSIDNGFYYGGLSTQGTKPFDYFYVINSTKDAQGFQLASNVNATELKFRRIQSGVWSSWYELITTANISSYQSGLGVGQTWKDVLSSRKLGTTYTNTTSKPIMINITTPTGDGLSVTEFYVNSVRIGYACVQKSWSQPSTTSFIVPPGSTYSVTSDRAVYLWAELS